MRISMQNFRRGTAALLALALLLGLVGCKQEDPVTEGVQVEEGVEAPEFVLDRAVEAVQAAVDYFESSLGPIEQAKIIGLTRMDDGTADPEVDIQLWLLEYRLLPTEQEGVVLAGGMSLEEGWLTEWGSTGQPLLAVAHDERDDSWIDLGRSSTQAVQEDHGGMYTVAAWFRYQNRSYALLENDYDSAWISDLFDVGDSLMVGLTAEGTAYDTYTTTERWYAGRFDVLMDGYVWTPLPQEGAPSSAARQNEALYTVSIRAANGRDGFLFFAQSDIVCRIADEKEHWYVLTDKYADDITLAESVRQEYDNLEVDSNKISFYYSGDPEQVVQLFAREIYGSHLLNRAPGASGGITDYRAVSWQLMESSENGKALVGSFEYAVIPERENDPDIWAGNTVEGEGEYEGWLIMYHQFVLEIGADGNWHCTDMGTGGATLPEKDQ